MHLNRVLSAALLALVVLLVGNLSRADELTVLDEDVQPGKSLWSLHMRLGGGLGVHDDDVSYHGAYSIELAVGRFFAIGSRVSIISVDSSYRLQPGGFNPDTGEVSQRTTLFMLRPVEAYFTIPADECSAFYLSGGIVLGAVESVAASASIGARHWFNPHLFANGGLTAIIGPDGDAFGSFQLSLGVSIPAYYTKRSRTHDD